MVQHTHKPILDSDGNELNVLFHTTFNNFENIEHILEEIDSSITPKNNQIKSVSLINPSSVSKSLWNAIWSSTSESPMKCLYNVVELFIFKFLSDLNVLPTDMNFNAVFLKSKTDPKAALTFYARNTRKHIREQLFPEGDDGTTIINGIIFVDENDEPNLDHAILFRNCLKHIYKFEKEFGSLTKIDKEFKTKLYETFLKQELKAMGQYFTPRKIVQTIIRMSGLDNISDFKGKKICDPFCGVGGFPLEIINMNDRMFSEYAPKNKKIKPSFELKGFDRGSASEHQRTIVLAKANMLIYLAEHISKNNGIANEYAQIFNDTFYLFKDNLGTFGYVDHIGEEKEDKKFDYILTNPPYVTSASRNIKDEIESTPKTKGLYPINAMGLEGLATEWIINSLKQGGKAFIILPNGCMTRETDKKLRDFILNKCYLNAIIQLPVQTFFTNQRGTVILAITKKHEDSKKQVDPVFCYLVSNIGEKLSSKSREYIPENELPNLEYYYKMYVNSSDKDRIKSEIESKDKRCKCIDITHFSHHDWNIEMCWTEEERKELGIPLSDPVLTISEYETEAKSLKKNLIDDVTSLDFSIPKEPNLQCELQTIKLKELFHFTKGNSKYTKEYTDANKGIYPVYSANTKGDGTIGKIKTYDFETDGIIITTNGIYAGSVRLISKHKFSMNGDAGLLYLKKDIFNIDLSYIAHKIHHIREEYGFNWINKPTNPEIENIEIQIPISADSTKEKTVFCLSSQIELSKYYSELELSKDKIEKTKLEILAKFEKISKAKLLKD